MIVLKTKQVIRPEPRNLQNKMASVEPGKVSSAVKRLDSVLKESTGPVVVKPQITQFKTTYAENYRDNVALTVRSKCLLTEFSFLHYIFFGCFNRICNGRSWPKHFA